MCRLDARCTKAIAAELTTPEVAGDTTPIIRMRIEKNRPNLCFRSVTNATRAAIVWTNIDEKSAHRNMWYHISRNVWSELFWVNPITSWMESNVYWSLVEIITCLAILLSNIDGAGFSLESREKLLQCDFGREGIQGSLFFSRCILGYSAIF